MTAAQYYVKEQRLARSAASAPHWLGFFTVLTLAGIWGAYVMLGDASTILGSFFLVVVLPTASATFGANWLLKRIHRRFVEGHKTEMEYLQDWIDVMGLPDRYPVDEAAKRALAPEILTRLEIYARNANTAFRMRDLVREMRDCYEKNSSGWGLVDNYYRRLCVRAEEANGAYRGQWKVFIDELEIIDFLGDPQEFREQFLKNDPLASASLSFHR